MQPSAHWLTHVGEGVVYEKDKHVNQKTKKYMTVKTNTSVFKHIH